MTIDWAQRNATVERINHLNEERNKLARLYYLLDLDGLRRVNRAAAFLTVEDLSQVIEFAEGLAFWRGLEPVSGEYAAVSDPTPQGKSSTG